MARLTKVLISGAGSIGRRHAKNLVALGYHNLAVCDPDEKKLRAFGEILKVPVYGDFRLALQKEKPAIVFICSPTHLHVLQALAAVESGADVFIEKPLSHSLAEVDKLIRKTKEEGRVAMVACNFRFHSGFKKLANILQTKRYGKPITARINAGYYLPGARKGTNYKNIYAAKKTGGGVILDSGSHTVNYLEPLLGKILSGAVFKSPMHTLGIESEEAAFLFFRHETGAITSVSLDYVSRHSEHTIEIVTDKGKIFFDIRENLLTFEDEKAKKILYRGSKDLNLMFKKELRHFLECVEKRKKPLQDLKEAKRALEILLSAKASY